MSNLIHIMRASLVRAGTLVDPGDFYVMAERPDGEVKVNCKPDSLLKNARSTVEQIAMMPEVRAKMVKGFKYSGRAFFWLVKKYASPRVLQRLLQYLDQALMISNPDPIVARRVLASALFSVIEADSRATQFIGSWDECTTFIRNFDATHTEYTDLRILDNTGAECDSHKPEPSVVTATSREDLVRTMLREALGPEAEFDPPTGSKIESGDRVMYVTLKPNKIGPFKRLAQELVNSPRYGVTQFSPKPPRGWRVQFK